MIIRYHYFPRKEKNHHHIYLIKKIRIRLSIEIKKCMQL